MVGKPNRSWVRKSNRDRREWKQSSMRAVNVDKIGMPERKPMNQDLILKEGFYLSSGFGSKKLEQ